MTRPSIPMPDWASMYQFVDPDQPWHGGQSKLDPPSGYIAQGFMPSYPVPAEYVNYLHNVAGQWVRYLDSENSARMVDIANPHQLLGMRLSSQPTDKTNATTAWQPCGAHCDIQLATNDIVELAGVAWASVSGGSNGDVTLGVSTDGGATYVVANAAQVCTYAPSDGSSTPRRPQHITALHVAGAPTTYRFDLIVRDAGSGYHTTVYALSTVQVRAWRPGAGRSIVTFGP